MFEFLMFRLLIGVAILTIFALPPALSAANARRRTRAIAGIETRLIPIELDPREWRKEHRTALIGAIALGCAIGFVFGIAQIEHISNRWSSALYEIGKFEFFDYGLMTFYPTLFWTVFGGMVGGATVTITQLMRK